MGLLFQLLGAGVVCYLSLMLGFMFSWPSSIIDLFQSENTTLSRVMTGAEISLLGSLSSMGALISTPIFGYILDKIGRRYSLFVAGVPYLISWTIISTCRNVEAVLLAMFISGIGGGAFVVTPVFLSEICQNSIRGTVTSGSIIFIGLGSLLSFITGGYLSYYVNVYMQLTITVIYMFLVSFIKESPMYLLQKGLDEEAMISIAFYRNQDKNSKEVIEELYNLKRILSSSSNEGVAHVDADATLAEKEKLNELSISEKRQNMSPWKFLIKSKSSQLALAINLIMMTSSIFMGLVIVQVYAQPLFAEVVPSMSPSLCSILFAVICIASSMVSAYLVEVTGRKVLFITAALASGLCTALLGSQLHLKWGPDIITPISIYLFCISYSLGAGTVPFILVGEIFLPEVKSICSMLIVEWSWMNNFLLLLIFNPLKNALGMGPVFYLFSAIAFSSALFSYYFQPETKGVSVDVIQRLLLKNSSTKVLCCECGQGSFGSDKSPCDLKFT